MPSHRVYRSVSARWLYLLAAGCLALAAPLHAADKATPSEHGTSETLAFDEAVRRGLARHPLLRIAQHDVLQSQAVTKQIEAANYPWITGVYANTAGNTRVLANLGISGSLPKPTNYLTTPGLRVDWLITDFGFTAHRILANKALTASADKNRLTTKAVVILNIQQAYINCLKHQRFVDIAREVLKERGLIRDQAETLYRHNLRSRLDFDFAVVEAQRAELGLIKAQNDLTAAYANLSFAMGAQGADAYSLEFLPLEVKTPPALEQLFGEAIAHRPELLGNEDRIRAAEEFLQAARAQRFGTVSAIGTTGYTWWGREERPSGKEVSNPGAQLGWWGAGGTSSFPLYTGGRIEGRIEEAEARKGEVVASARSIANDVMLQVARAYYSQLTAAQRIAVDAERVAHAREALTLARERYKANLGSILDVTTATMDVLNAEVSLAESQYNYQLSEAAVAYAAGTEYGRY